MSNSNSVCFCRFVYYLGHHLKTLFSEAKAGGHAHYEQERQEHGGALAHPAPLGVLWYGEYLIASIVIDQYHEHDGERAKRIDANVALWLRDYERMEF